ncbi:hypothetical protein CVT24_008259 [Panaeolus cyanescens]|uniref:Uncharacterized protein n=1 Tax=Panaeolus cyanescens TaxID=181874 RepID=A0A409VF97_9AGAR|nr:hypothetical protein CVT24_008259 [Panaeolus cyanescens]
MPRVNYTDEVFKKVDQVVGRPPTTDHNINDDYVRKPPHNLDNPINPAHKPKGANPKHLAEKELSGEGPAAILKEEETGRNKKTDELASIAQDDSLHS